MYAGLPLYSSVGLACWLGTKALSLYHFPLDPLPRATAYVHTGIADPM